MIRLLVLIYFLFFTFNSLFAQKSVEIKGKVVSNSNFLEGIHVVNKSKDIGVTTSAFGYFTIMGSEQDTLIFSAVHLKATQYIITNLDVENKTIKVSVEQLLTELEEITLLKYKNITPEALGIIPEGMKTYTPAERRLAASQEFKWYSPLLIPVGGMSVDGLINAISGRTNMLKKELEVERNELLIEKVKLKYDKNYLVDELEIPEDNVEGFYFYIIDDPKFRSSFKSNNFTMCAFILPELKKEFIEKYQINENN